MFLKYFGVIGLITPIFYVAAQEQVGIDDNHMPIKIRRLLLDYRNDCDKESSTARALNHAIVGVFHHQFKVPEHYIDEEAMDDTLQINVDGDYPAYKRTLFSINTTKYVKMAESVDTNQIANISDFSLWKCNVSQTELKNVGVSVVSLEDCPLLDPARVKSILQNVECVAAVELDSYVAVDGTFDDFMDQKYEDLSHKNEDDDPLKEILSGQYWMDKIRLKEAWPISSGSHQVVVGVIDSGVAVDHPALKSSIWVNKGEIPGNGIDDDHNGFIDDVNGFDFFTGIGRLSDGHGHGTHVSGIIGSIPWRNSDVYGVCQKIRIAGLRFMDDTGVGATSAAIEAINYAVQMGFIMTNNSWGSGQYSEVLFRTIHRANQAGQLFVAAAGNRGWDMDRIPHYPAAYPLPNVIAVAATDEDDHLASFSNTGENSVHVAAPGRRIISTYPPDTYRSMSGTSMATPIVTGVAALVVALGDINYRDLKTLLISSGDIIAELKGKVKSGARISAYHAVREMFRRSKHASQRDETHREYPPPTQYIDEPNADPVYA